MLSSDNRDRAAHSCWEMLQLRGQSMIQWTHLEALTLTFKNTLILHIYYFKRLGFFGVGFFNYSKKPPFLPAKICSAYQSESREIL